MADLLDSIQVETAPNPTVAVIWMHGLGADGHDFEPIVPELGLPTRPAIRFVFPHAPLRPVTINQGHVMRAWYDIRALAGVRREDEAGVRQSAKQVEALMERERQRAIAPGRLVLAGFSQGGAMALHVGLRYRERLAGVLALSCYLPLAATLATEASPANRDVPIFWAHGVHDPMIPLAMAEHGREQVAALGYPIEWHQYPMPHSVCAEEIADIARWLGRVLGA
ncbi:MAG TPA: alpha/beta hydrolase fold domain-containing protein [Methylomirabilota bacterium]|jgi:phospholipase/carboxylesterase|nr:alpha/beta hydrolase fold domain-containing protein [Methylomirabilota bacterium]